MATEKRLIDANAFRDFWNKNYRHQYANDNFLVALANFPTVDSVEVVRCKDCKYGDMCSIREAMAVSDWNAYCYRGERKDNE